MSLTESQQRLFDALAAITTNPTAVAGPDTTWLQDVWVADQRDSGVSEILGKDWCGTACCLYGALALRAGAVPARACAAFEWTGESTASVRTPDGKIRNIASYVEALVPELAHVGAMDANNTLAELWSLAHLATNGAVTCPPEWDELVYAIDEAREDIL